MMMRTHREDDGCDELDWDELYERAYKEYEESDMGRVHHMSNERQDEPSTKPRYTSKRTHTGIIYTNRSDPISVVPSGEPFQEQPSSAIISFHVIPNTRK